MDVNSILKKHPKHKDSLIEILHDIQDHAPQKHISEESIRKVAHYLNMPIAQIHGVVGYYSMFSLKPRGRFIIQVCKSPVCSMMGSQSVYDAVKSKIDSYSDKSLFTIEKVECLGQCNQSPCMMVNNTIHGNLNSEKVEIIIDELVLSDKNARQ